MYSKNYKMCILLSVYNQEKYIRTIIESILLQKTNFPFLLLIIDNASTDNTLHIIKECQEYNNMNSMNPLLSIDIITQENHHNSTSLLYHGYTKMLEYSSIDYFSILDTYTFYTRTDILQLQVDYLDANPQCFACTHPSLQKYKELENRIIFSDPCNPFIENLQQKGFDIFQCYPKEQFYNYSSTLLYRNRLITPIPEYAILDTNKNTLLLLYYLNTRKTIGYINIIGSARVITSEKQHVSEEQNVTQKQSCLNLMKFTQNIEEKKIISSLYKSTHSLRNNTEQVDGNTPYPISPFSFPLNSLEMVRSICTYHTHHYTNKNRWNGAYSSCYLDSLIESYGKLLTNNAITCMNKTYNDDMIAFIVPGFIINSGGILGHILVLIDIFLEAGKEIHFFSTGLVPDAKTIFNKLFHDKKNVHFTEYPDIDQLGYDTIYQENISYLTQAIYSLAPQKLFCYLGHNDLVASAITQKGIAKEIILDFVYDHGFINGICSSAVDTILVHNLIYKKMIQLSHQIPSHRIKVILPTCPPYQGPCYTARKPKITNTATASIRPTKIENDFIYPYADVIANVLSHTKGKHYHFGMLSEWYINTIRNNLEELHIDPNNFVHIPFATTFVEDTIGYEIDLFISSFPIHSAITTIKLTSAGIPIVDYKGINHTQRGDLIHAGILTWQHPEELYTLINSLSYQELEEVSDKQYEFYLQYNELSIIKQYYLDMDSIPDIDIRDNDFAYHVIDLSHEFQFDSYILMGVPLPNTI